MACYWPGSSPGAAEADEYASSSMLDAAAGAVAARGVLFANVHQASCALLTQQCTDDRLSLTAFDVA